MIGGRQVLGHHFCVGDGAPQALPSTVSPRRVGLCDTAVGNRCHLAMLLGSELPPPQ